MSSVAGGKSVKIIDKIRVGRGSSRPRRGGRRSRAGPAPPVRRRRDVLIGGPTLAAQALEAGLVDERHLIVWPVIRGGRNPALPTHRRIDLAHLDEHRFANGVVHLRYRARSN